MKSHPKFTLGQLVHHVLFGYRGVVIDIDDGFAHTSDWHDLLATTEAPNDEPWYRVLVHGGEDQETYVAEQNLEPDASGLPIQHPRIDEAFDVFVDGHYARTRNLS